MSVLHLHHPPGYLAERKYIYDVIFQEFLGITYQTYEEDRTDIRIVLSDGINGTDSKELAICDVLLQTQEHEWLTAYSLPITPLDHYESQNQRALPVIYGKLLSEGTYFYASETRIELGIDVFGSIFFMLTRYEELVKPERDHRVRFPASASLALEGNFLERPIVNEYVELLYSCLQQLWPQISRIKRHYRTYLSHDVDVPLLAAGRSLRQVMKNAAGDIVRHKSFTAAIMRMRSYMRGKLGDYDSDDANTFDFIMDVSEQKGVQSAFYFITSRSAGTIDGDYSMQDPWIRKLLRNIHTRGHEIGLHPSYNSFDQKEMLLKEFSILKASCQDEEIVQERWGGRQHYLRFDAAHTWQAWELTGLDYDSTLSYADHVGFRSGVCYEYPVFDLRMRQQLNLRERPLIVMEQTLLSGDYMQTSVEDAYDKTIELSRICKMFNGDFTLLWHNDELIEPKQRELYQNIVKVI